MIRITGTLTLADRDVAERFVRATGPHGQNVTRAATGVELRVDLSRASLPADLKDRLRARAGRHLTRNDVLVIVSTVFRSQLKNREGARTRLAALLKRAAVPVRPRIATESATTPARRLEQKHWRGVVKRGRHARTSTP